ncbi:MAG: hypothetical protein A3J58_01015 [Candidatus Sungbacteria bacterium RIFCSPHIGHO2_02_FULL_52_23]|uniref:Uncharacterized protein n=1 Tax=Candidatus Sungbacteria bacterium RIFCSPHIGHO2_02_FULL_52_23 TaxID=1802274 RepID=A0A1G2KTZ0_9BACT|nr:MAG: hypothetical protein A3J58_01015 [Candidatus Sungbacteria bacterium RIFCSPHIGHO2_02_FULL_52_23]
MNEVGASPTSALQMRKRDIFKYPAVFGFAPNTTKCASLALYHPILHATAPAEILYHMYALAVRPARYSAFADSHRPCAQCPVRPLFLALKNMKDLHLSLLLE